MKFIILSISIIFNLLPLSQPLPLVDAGLFVILGVSTCRDGAGYCLLGTDCTLDHDFSPDDTGGHCNGLRAAFTPAANFVCCKYNGATTTTQKTPSTTSSSTTTVKSTPSRRPVINTGGAAKPSVSDEPGAVFWVDLSSSSSPAPQGTKIHPGSDITVSGNMRPSAVAVKPVSFSAVIRPGATLSDISAVRPGSTVTVDGVLDGLVQGISAEVAHGVSVSHDPVTPSLELEAVEPVEDEQEQTLVVNSIENHEPTSIFVTPTTSFPVKVTTSAPVTSAPVKVTTKAPVVTSTKKPPTTPDDEDEEDEDEDESEEEDEEDDDEDDGLFGLTDLADLFLGSDTAASGAAKNSSGITLQQRMDEIEESTTQQQEEVTDEEAPPLCLGPVREPRDPACWAVRFKSDDMECTGARVSRELVVTSAACAVRVSVGKAKAVLSGERKAEIMDVIVHENYRAAPHAALNDIGLVRLIPPGPEKDLCTVCLPQDKLSDFSQSSCMTPKFSADNQVELMSRSTSQRAVCESQTRLRTEQDERFPTLLCSESKAANEDRQGAPLVCTGRIPVLAGVLMTARDAELYTPISHYVEWIQTHQQA